MRKLVLVLAAAAMSVAAMVGAAGSAQAMRFNPDACLDLSRKVVVEDGVRYGFVKMQGPTNDPCGMPWKAVRLP